MNITAVKGLAVATGLTLLASACASGNALDDARHRGATTAPSTSTTTAVATPTTQEEAVIDAYLAGIDAFYAAANPPNPNHPLLEATHSGGLLTSVKDLLAELKERGTAIRRSPLSTNNPRILELSRTRAILEDCAFDADVEYESATDKVVDDARVFVRFEARLERRDGAWTTVAVEAEELRASCAA